jgi:hypothetical protein
MPLILWQTDEEKINLKNATQSLKISLWIATCFFLTIYFFNSFFLYGSSFSVDLAHHYVLVANIYEHWELPIDNPLKDIPYAHIFAAISGTFLGSPLAGIQFSVLVSLLALWSALAFAFQSLPNRGFCLSAFLLLVLLLLNDFVQLGVHGREIVGNFFFPQLVAQAVSLLALVLSLYSEKAETNQWLIYLFLAACILFIEKIHLLPSIELLGFFVLLIVFDSFFFIRKTRAQFLALPFSIILLTLAALISNPAFETMRAISHNNGGIMVKHIAGLKSLATFCIVVAVLSVFLVIKWLKINSAESKRNTLLLKYIGLYGLSVSGLCLLQICLLSIGEGSEYACKKYGFALNTLLLIDLSLLGSVFFKPLWFQEETNNSPALIVKICQTIFPSTLLLFVFFTVLPQKTASVSSIASLIHSVEAYRDTLIEKSSPGRFNYAIGLSEFGGTVDAMISRAILKVEDENVMDILLQKPFSKPERIGYLITLEGKLWDISICRKHVSPDSLVLLDGTCVLAHLKSSTKGIR